MCNLFETQYTTFIFNNNILLNTSSNNITKSSIQSILEADFDDDNEDLDELERYISEKSINKEIDILIWWKVNNNKFL